MICMIKLRYYRNQCNETVSTGDTAICTVLHEKFQFWGRGLDILCKHRSKVPKSSMRSSQLPVLVGMKSSNSRGGILYHEQDILCDFDNIFVPLDLVPASQPLIHQSYKAGKILLNSLCIFTSGNGVLHHVARKYILSHSDVFHRNIVAYLVCLPIAFKFLSFESKFRDIR